MIKKCTGCGIILQTEDINKEGYTENIDNELCLRCFKLKNYGEYKAVTLNNKDYTDILNSIPKDALVVYLTSLLNINLEYINKDGFALMLPFTYDNNKVNKYVHHEKFFNSVMEYIDWSDKIGIRNVSDINKMLAEGKWNDLIFMSEATYNKNLLDISETISKNEDIKMVLIAGPSCSGKTTTSKKLEMFLESKGLNPVALSVDDYFKERIDTPLDEDGNKDYESINAIDTELFNDQLSRLLKC